MSGWTLAFQIVNFLVLAGLLQRFLFKPVNQMVARRQLELDQVTSESARLRQEAEDLRKEAEHARAGIVDERDRAVAEARAEIKHERDALLAKASLEASAVVESGHHDVEIERETAADGMANAAVDIGVGIARHLLREIATPHIAESFLDRICEHLDALPVERRGILSKELEGRELLVATASPLSSEQQTRWLASLSARLGDGIGARFVNDDALIVGAELRFPQTTLSFCWRDSLRTAREELIHRADLS